ncbi:MAG: nucleotidyl transferase AbiEii/AbiGii toxin family protein [Thermoplasmata archaeon]|nr:nucleotidyl transferase AbiEii/AbiGii toxin family protein [Thermoplasmata archaeon]
MITKEELIRISRITGMKAHQQEKHYVQTLALRSLYSKFSPAFKGGTALMFIHGLNRFSEDLDFTVMENLDGRDILKTVIGDLNYIGVSAVSKIISDGDVSFSFRIGAEGPLFTREIERCYIRMELSRREKVTLVPKSVFIECPYPDILPFSVNVMDTKEIMAEKVRAILTRNRARDVYDLWYLIKDKEPPDQVLVNAKLEYYNRKFDVEELKQSIEAKGDIWKAELAPILFGPLPDFHRVRDTIMKKWGWGCGRVLCA